MAAIAAAWFAFMAGAVVGGAVRDFASFAIAAASGAMLVVVGFAAASHSRTLVRSDPANRPRLALLALAIGAALGLANLAANWAIAAIDPAIRALLTARVATLGAVDAVIAAPLTEEVAVRLFLMSVMAWLVSRFTKRGEVAFAIALVGSALVFALLHLDRALPADPVLADYYRAALVLKYTLAGVPLGWIFWRWGLPYAMLCHMAVNAVHLALENSVF